MAPVVECLFDRWTTSVTRVKWSHIATTVPCSQDAAFLPVCLMCPRELADRELQALYDRDRVEPFD